MPCATYVRTSSSLEVDTEPTGTVLVLLPDPGDRTLLEAYDGLARAFVAPDPQEVPAEVIERRHALEPQRVLSSSAWSRVVGLRDSGARRPRRSRGCLSCGRSAVNALEVGILDSVAWREEGAVHVALHLPGLAAADPVEVRFRDGERRVRRPATVSPAAEGSLVEVAAPARRLADGAVADRRPCR